MSDVVSVEETALIRPTVEEELFRDINRMKNENLNIENSSKVSYLSKELYELFIHLVHQYYNITGAQVKRLSRDKQKALILLVTEKARKEGSRYKFFIYAIPFFGWLFFGGIDAPRPLKYTNNISDLKKILGDTFDPAETIIQRLQCP